MDEVPKQAYTMGIKNIMAAKKNSSCSNTGSAKADALAQISGTDRSQNVPASILQTSSGCKL